MTFPIVAMTTLAGCEGGGSDCEDITLGGVTTCVDPNAGAQSLANTQWVLVDESGNAQLTLVFDAGGNLVEFTDSPLLANSLGSDLILDDAPHGTGLVDKLEYSAVAFEVVGDPVDGIRQFTILTNVDLFFDTGLPFLGSIDIAAGTANASGTIEGDTMTGVFIFEFEIDAGIQGLLDGPFGAAIPSELPLDAVNETFAFTAIRSGA